jgi:hypothetical protein
MVHLSHYSIKVLQSLFYAKRLKEYKQSKLIAPFVTGAAEQLQSQKAQSICLIPITANASLDG